MKIEKIGYFLSVARHLNFTKAAQECHIAQPAISRQMSSLEEELGFALFDRSSRKVRLTPAGQSFYTSMMRFVNDYDSGVEQLRHISDEQLQMVVCTGALGISPLLSRTLGDLHIPFPTLHLELVHGCGMSAERWLMERQGELVFSWGEFRQLPKEIAAKPICTRGCAVLMSQESPLAKSNHLSCAMLREHSFILPAVLDEEFSRHYRRLLEELKLFANSNLIAQDRDSLFFMIRAGMGMALAPQGIFEAEPQGIAVRPLDDAGEFGSWKVLYRREDTLRPLKHLLGILEEKYVD
ncbi:MAG: LysR family transcriptional regulator [Negativibacillus sp.]